MSLGAVHRPACMVLWPRKPSVAHIEDYDSACLGWYHHALTPTQCPIWAQWMGMQVLKQLPWSPLVRHAYAKELASGSPLSFLKNGLLYILSHYERVFALRQHETAQALYRRLILCRGAWWLSTSSTSHSYGHTAVEH